METLQDSQTYFQNTELELWIVPWFFKVLQLWTAMASWQLYKQSISVYLAEGICPFFPIGSKYFTSFCLHMMYI